MVWFSGTKSSNGKIPWEQLTDLSQLEELLNQDAVPILLFKHSTRCSISSMALSRFESEWNTDLNCKLVFLDLLSFRNISDEIAERTGVEHQSPQAILINKGKVIYHASHNGISANKIEQLIVNL